MSNQDKPPSIDGLLETSLYARDLANTAAFYRDLFEFKALVDTPRAKRPLGVSVRRHGGRQRRRARHDTGP